MTPRRRPAVTLMELVVVLALLLILAAAIAPSISGMRGNDYQKTAADVVRTRLADARAFAMEDGKGYRVAVSTDGTKIRLAPDAATFSEGSAGEADFLARTSETTLEKATVEVAQEADQDAPETDGGGWVTIAAYKPDGTCRRDRALVNVKQDGYQPIQIQVRGVTGTVRTTPNTPGNANGQPTAGKTP